MGNNVSKGIAKLEEAVATGEAAKITISIADDNAPFIGGVNNLVSASELARTISFNDLNGFTRELFATTLGFIAGVVAATPTGSVAIGVAADWYASEQFKKAYDRAN